MSIHYSKTFSSLQEQLHEEEVLYNEAVRMHASPDVIQSIKELIEKHRAELDKQDCTTGFYYHKNLSVDVNK